MTNALTLIASTGQLPDYLRNGELKYEDSGIGAGIAPRAPKLSVTTAKQWAITKDGQTMILPQPTVRGVLVASAENITKAWYAKAYTPGSTEAPDCYSNDGRIPAPGCKAPQSSNCAQCPKNAFGSHPVTGRGKACGDRKLVVLVWEGLPNELMTFNVPTMSMQSLRKIDTELRNHNIPIQSVMVEMSFDPAVQYPVVKIAAVGFIDKDTALSLLERSRTQEVADLLREVDYDDQPDQPQGAASPVPQQTFQLGQQGTAAQQFPPAENTSAAHQAPPVNTTLQQPEKPKRTRRTKAEMEAARAAEAAGQAQGAGQQLLQTMQNQAAMQQVAHDAPAMQQQTIGAQPQQFQQPSVLVDTNVAYAAHTQAAAQPAATQAPAGGMDVAALLAKWQNPQV